MSIRNYFLLNLNIFLFSSVLYRTQQTVIQISKTIRERLQFENITSIIKFDKIIYVIPCSNETNKSLLAYINNKLFTGNCDSTILSSIIPNENICACCVLNTNILCNYKINDYIIDWFYTKKYGCSENINFFNNDLQILSDILFYTFGDLKRLA